MPVVFRSPFGEVSLVDAFRATAEERARSMGRSEAVFWLRAIDDGLVDRIASSSREPWAVPWPSHTRRPDQRAEVRRRLAEAIDAGWVLAVRTRRRALLVPLEVDDETLGPDDSEKLRVDFVFDYADGNAAHDLPYVLEDSGGAKTAGTLPKDGSIARDNASGTYAVSLKEIDALQWQPARVKYGEPAKVLARVTGLDDGARGSARVYRLYDEDEKAAVATLAATVAGGAAEVAWTPDAGAAAGPPDAEGLVYYVAELSFENGRVWRKTAPLAVEPPAITSATWSAPDADDGDDVSLVVETVGFADGAQVKVALVAHDLMGDDVPLGDAPPAAVAGGAATLAFEVGEGILHALSYDVIAEITVEGDGAKARACSPILRVHPAPLAGDGADDAAGAQA
jgi:hypothetical protein